MGITPCDTVLFRTRMAPGKLVPLHSHIDPECFYVLEGRLEVFLMDDAPKWNVVQAGRSLLVTDGIKHAVRNSAETAADLVLATNNRFANFLGEAGRLVAANAPFAAPDIQSPLPRPRSGRLSDGHGRKADGMFRHAMQAFASARLDRWRPGWVVTECQLA